MRALGTCPNPRLGKPDKAKAIALPLAVAAVPWLLQPAENWVAKMSWLACYILVGRHVAVRSNSQPQVNTFTALGPQPDDAASSARHMVEILISQEILKLLNQAAEHLGQFLHSEKSGDLPGGAAPARGAAAGCLTDMVGSTLL